MDAESQSEFVLWDQQRILQDHRGREPCSKEMKNKDEWCVPKLRGRRRIGVWLCRSRRRAWKEVGTFQERSTNHVTDADHAYSVGHADRNAPV